MSYVSILDSTKRLRLTLCLPGDPGGHPKYLVLIEGKPSSFLGLLLLHTDPLRYLLAFIELFSYSSLANTTDSLSASGLGTHRNWLQGLPDSPLIQPVSEGSEGSGQKELKLRFDVSQYSPEEIVVKTVDNKLLVRICSLDYFFLHDPTTLPNFLLLEFL